jgi:hypothetical protein
MIGAACSRCGAYSRRIEWHHPTGRIRHKPIHRLAVPLCVPCHLAEHAIWARLGLDAAAPDRAVIVRRLAVFCHLQDFDDLAEECADLAEALDAEAA